MNEVSCHMAVTFLVIIITDKYLLRESLHEWISQGDFFFKASILCLNIPISSSGIPGIYVANYFQNNVTPAK